MNLNEFTASQLKTEIPQFSIGDTVKVHVNIREGDK
ncbi:MAG: 50S ribosomal protein L19, partial [Acutalibacteraceae bacterium]